MEMGTNSPMENRATKQPLEIDIRKILEQLGIPKDKWPEEYRTPVR